MLTTVKLSKDLRGVVDPTFINKTRFVVFDGDIQVLKDLKAETLRSIKIKKQTKNK